MPIWPPGRRTRWNFGEAVCVVGEIAEAEGGGDEIDGGVGEGKVEGVGFDGEDVVPSVFLGWPRESIWGRSRRRGWGLALRVWRGLCLVERDGHVAGSAAEVESDGFGTLEDGAEDAGGAGPPGAVDADGEEVVGAVVGWGDGVEHLLDVGRGGLLGGSACGTGSGGAFVFGLGSGGHRMLLDGGFFVAAAVSVASEDFSA